MSVCRPGLIDVPVWHLQESAPSRFLREQFVAFGIPPEKILFHECGLQTDTLRPAPKALAPQRTRGKRPLVFGYIGVVDPVKGVQLLVEAFQTRPQAELRLYGGEAAYAPYPDEKRLRLIREAFLAHTPVITAAFGGMREWVRDGVNGLLFEPRNIADLRQRMRRFITEPTLVARLSRAFPAVRSIRAEAALLAQLYRRLLP